jgi:hypothetical protein
MSPPAEITASRQTGRARGYIDWYTGTWGRSMTGAVYAMSDHRAVFVLPQAGGAVVFIASRGPKPRIGHECWFADNKDAAIYANQLFQRFDCVVVGGDLRRRGAGDR